MSTGVSKTPTSSAVSYNAIEVEDLTKYYGNVLAVDHVSFVVHQGEVFAAEGWDTDRNPLPIP